MAHPLVVHCRRDPYDVYVGRGRCPETGEKGCWGNPFSHKDGTTAHFKVASREEAIDAYRHWLWAQIEAGAISLEDLAALAGMRLGCWCAPYHRCHGEVLAAASEWAAYEQGQRTGAGA